MRLPSWPVRILIAGLALVSFAIFIHWWSSPAVQAPRTFARLQQAFTDGDAGDVLAQVHADYDFAGLWPTVPWGELGSGDGNRSLALRGLSGLFFLHRENRLSLAIDVLSMTPKPDGQVEAIVTMQLTSAQGDIPFQLGPIRRHRFLLASSSWLGRLTICGHDPISFNR